MQIPFSEACERNKDPILNVVGEHFDTAKNVLEIGSGTGQHAVYFARSKPHLLWQTADQAEYLDGIHAQLDVANVDNVLRPLSVDVKQAVWVADATKFDLVYTANTFHIMAESDVKAFFSGLSNVLQPNGVVIVYGPFKYQGEFTSESNASFDQRLQERGVGSGIREFEWVNQLANEAGLSLLADHVMPANNQCLIWSANA